MLLDELSGFGQSFDDVVLVFDVHHVAAFDAAHGVAGQHEPSSRAVWSEWGACFVACGCEQPNKLTAFHDALRQALKADARRPKHERRTAKALYAEIRRAGYVGGYTSSIEQENRERDSVAIGSCA
ncbi:hypothetical protein GALL_241140 [mine drainage metagenome]|uniref:Uncharacterized protein n=1 Tax=mine drainage metagenome TaxID=410659 RepID=A0A1J5RCV5_9ZZZZ